MRVVERPAASHLIVDTGGKEKEGGGGPWGGGEGDFDNLPLNLRLLPSHETERKKTRNPSNAPRKKERGREKSEKKKERDMLGIGPQCLLLP